MLDVETGEVLGVHIAGVRLLANYAVPAPAAAELLRRPTVRPRPPGDLIPGPSRRRRGRRRAPDHAGSAPTLIAETRRRPPSPTALSAYDEADALGGERPALLATDWASRSAGPWAPVLQARAAQLDQALRAHRQGPAGRRPIRPGTAARSWSATGSR